MDKWIDRLLETSWFMKVVAFVFAFFLFQGVYDSNNDTSIINVATRTETSIIKDVPVTAYYDTENLVITGIPETIDVTLTGPVNVLQAAKIQKDFEVYVDLKEVQIGLSDVPVQINNISDKLKVQFSQSIINIDVQEKITEKFDVAVEYNQSLIEEGYAAELPDLAPNQVSITGGKTAISQIAYVKASVDISGSINETIQKQAEVIALDAKMNKLDVVIEPNIVEVVIPIRQLVKEVPIVIVEENELPNNLAITSIQLAQDDVKIFGAQTSLDLTNKVEAILNLSVIRESGTYALTFRTIEGISQFNPSTVQAIIEVVEVETEGEESPVNTSITESRVFAQVPIKIKNLSSDYEATYSGARTVNVFGPSNILFNLTASDFKLEVDATNLKEGKHEATIIVNGPSNITWQLDKEWIELTVSPKSTGN